MELVSVIIVCYNEKPDRIHETLRSVVLQDYPEVEIIVIDGGSVESTLDGFNEFRSRIVVFISESDRGIFDAMNKGVLRARGEWIIFMNIGDSFFSSSSLSGLLAEPTTDRDIIYGDVFKKRIGFTSSPRAVNGYLFYSSGICHQSLLARSSLFSADKVGLFNLEYRLCADPDWILRAYKSGVRFKYVPIIVCNYAGGGASSDYKLRNEYFSLVRHRNFSYIDRIVYSCRLFFQRIYRRLRSLNFQIPAGIKEKLTGSR